MKFIIAIVVNLIISMQVHSIEPYPLEYFAQRFNIDSVKISPDGTQMALLRIPSRSANPVLEIYQTTDLSKAPFKLDAKPMEITGYNWLSDKDIIISLRQKVRDKIEGFNKGVYESRFAKLNLRTKKVLPIREVGARIIHTLPNKPNKVIIGFYSDIKPSKKIPQSIRPIDYYELNLKSGTKKLLMRGKFSLANVTFDIDGNPRLGSGYDITTDEFVYYYRKVGSKQWVDYYRLHEDSFENFSVQAVDNTKADTVLVIAQNGEDKNSLWEFNTNTKSYGEKIYGRSDVDIGGIFRHSDRWNKKDDIAGLFYSLDKYKSEYFIAEEAALYKQLESIVPNAYNVSITSRAKTNNNMTVFNSGPHDPGSYYLVKENKLILIGSKNQKIKPENLADVKYIKYKARDGIVIRAYITIPHGEGPFPTIIMPHGGPFAKEVVGYSEWGQMLANNGYLVIQPQYRGSFGYGMKFYKSAFMPSGQGGRSMQDDKDDGIKHLIKKGLADPNRVAMFGWSYGGYAALIAASREDQLYQCVIAGAAVADMKMQANYYINRLRGSQKILQTKYRNGSINPIDEVSKVNVPILLIHGSVDQRVPVKHAKKYIKELKKHSKSFKYLELDGADHFSNSLFFNHKIELYETMIEYLKNQCGPGGL